LLQRPRVHGILSGQRFIPEGMALTVTTAASVTLLGRLPAQVPPLRRRRLGVYLLAEDTATTTTPSPNGSMQANYRNSPASSYGGYRAAAGQLIRPQIPMCRAEQVESRPSGVAGLPGSRSERMPDQPGGFPPLARDHRGRPPRGRCERSLPSRPTSVYLGAAARSGKPGGEPRDHLTPRSGRVASASDGRSRRAIGRGSSVGTGEPIQCGAVSITYEGNGIYRSSTVAGLAHLGLTPRRPSAIGSTHKRESDLGSRPPFGCSARRTRPYLSTNGGRTFNQRFLAAPTMTVAFDVSSRLTPQHRVCGGLVVAAAHTTLRRTAGAVRRLSRTNGGSVLDPASKRHTQLSPGYTTEPSSLTQPRRIGVRAVNNVSGVRQTGTWVDVRQRRISTTRASTFQRRR